MTTGKTIALTRRTFVGKVMSVLFNMLSRLVITFLPRRKRLLISWLQSPSAALVISIWFQYTDVCMIMWMEAAGEALFASYFSLFGIFFLGFWFHNGGWVFWVHGCFNVWPQPVAITPFWIFLEIAAWSDVPGLRMPADSRGQWFLIEYKYQGRNWPAPSAKNRKIQARVVLVNWQEDPMEMVQDVISGCAWRAAVHLWVQGAF